MITTFIAPIHLNALNYKCRCNLLLTIVTICYISDIVIVSYRMILSTEYSPFVWRRLLLHLLFFQATCLLLGYAGELRFCYNGPQRIRYRDCPGGFVAKEVVKASCMYYYKTDGVPNLETYITDDICEEDTNLRQLDADYQDFTATDFQSIIFHPEGQDPTDGADPGIDKCNASCLADWVPPKFWNVNSTRLLKDKEDLDEELEESYRVEYEELTKEILITIIHEDDYADDLEYVILPNNFTLGIGKPDFLQENASMIDAPFTSLMKLLAKSMKITYTNCSPFVEKSFYTLVFRTMIEWRRMNDDFPDINNKALKRLLKILDQCEKEQQPYFIINGTECEDKYVAQSITHLQSNTTKQHKLEPVSFRWERYDPIIEAAWSGVVFTHAFCFDFLSKDMLHYSLYVQGMNTIFEQPLVEKHWMYAFPVGDDMSLWEMAYDTADIENQMNSLDACVQAGYTGSIYKARLDRTFNEQDIVESSEYESDEDLPDPGWTRSLTDYWKMYESTGFNEMIDELGFCSSTTDKIQWKSNEYAEETCFLEDEKDKDEKDKNAGK